MKPSDRGLLVTICLPVFGGLAVLFLVAGFFFAAGRQQPIGRELTESELAQARTESQALAARLAELERDNRALLDRLALLSGDAVDRREHGAADVSTGGS